MILEGISTLAQRYKYGMLQKIEQIGKKKTHVETSCNICSEQ